MPKDKIGIAILGFGTVGGGTYKILKKNKEIILKRNGLSISVEAVLDRNKDRIIKDYKLSPAVVTDNISDVLSNPAVDIVVETMGGIEPAKTYILAALKSGKSVVSANKELIAKHWGELQAAAQKYKCGLYFEASCVGGVPIINTLKYSLQGENITSIKGIVNGTTNYILSKMSDEKMSYDDVLKIAVEKGYAEADPSADVEGYDAAYKMSILASLAFNACIPEDEISREGITKVSALDIAHGKELGYALKLLGIGKNTESGVEVRVRPTFIPAEHPLASVRGAFNAVFLTGDAADEIMLLGRGAGALPTGSAIVNDIITAAKAGGHWYTPYKNEGKIFGIKYNKDYRAGFYIRLTVLDKPGVLAKAGEIFGRHNVSICAVLQKGKYDDNTVPIVFVTHPSLESEINLALKDIKKLDVVSRIDSVINVEES
jgi:homoserine dehydrogenase